MWPGEKPALGKVIELNDHRAVIAGICDASAPFTTFPVVYAQRITVETGLSAYLAGIQLCDDCLNRTGIPVNFGITVRFGLHHWRGRRWPDLLYLRAREFAAIWFPEGHESRQPNDPAHGAAASLVVAGIGYAIGIGFCAAFFEF